MKMAGTQMSFCVGEENLQIESATCSSEASYVQPGFDEPVPQCLLKEDTALQPQHSSVVESHVAKFQGGNGDKKPGFASVEPSSKETIKSEEEMNNWAMKAVDVKILPTCDEYDSKSPKSQEVEELKWDALPNDVQGSVLRKLIYEDLFQFKRVSKSMRDFIESSAPFPSSQGDSVSQEASLTSLYFYIKHGDLQWSGFDLLLKKWRPLPMLRFLPCPDQNLFKEFLVCAGNGLLCANVSKSVEIENLVVCNPMTQIGRVLAPLNFRRNPVLMHMVTNATSYKIIVVGSSGMLRGQILSRKTEVYDSRTLQWEVTGDMPGVEFSLNEYQTGICINGILYCIAFLDDGSGKGVLAYDVDEGKWLLDWKCPLPGPGNANSSSVAQLVECDGEVYLFQERETGRTAEHCIDKLENDTLGGGSGRWKNIVREQQTGGRGLLVYPEYVCVGFGEGKLCIFNTIVHTGKVYDIHNGGYLGPLPLKLNQKGHKVLHISLNPLSFTFEPNFKSTV